MALAIVSVTHTAFTTDTTAHLVAMPATVDAGDLLVTLIATDGSATLTTPAGWTNLSSVPQSTTVRGSCSYKIAVGTEGGTTVDYVTTATEQAAAQVYRITGHLEIIGQLTAGTAVGSVNAGVATIDAPAVTAPWGVLSADNLFITYAATSGTQAIVNQPTGWSTPEKTSEGGYGQGAASAEMFSSWLLSPSATLDPASWTTSATGAISLSNTIVIRPRIGTVGLPVSIVVGTTLTSGTAQSLTIPAATAGNILLIQSHGRRASTTLAPGPPSVSDTSAVPLVWTPVFSPLPTQVGVSPGTAAQWWWAVADGDGKTVTVTWPNASTSVCIQSSVARFTIGAGLVPSFANQAWAGSTGTPSGAVTATFPAVPTTGINMLSFAGAGGSSSTIATGYTSLAAVAASPYRTGYDMTPGADAVMGANFLDQIVAAVNITEGGEVAVGIGQGVTASVGDVDVTIASSNPWTPAELGTDLIAWYDFADTATVIQSGGFLTQWNDKSGNARHGIAATTGTLSVNSDGIYIANATSGAGLGIQMPGLPSAYFDFAFAGKPNAAGSYRTIMAQAAGGQHHILIETGTNNLGNYSNAWFPAGSLTWPPVDGQVYFVGPSATGIKIGRDGDTPIDLVGENFAPDNAPFLFNYSVNGGQGFGTAREFVFMTASRSQDIQDKVSGYLAWKWDDILGVTTHVTALPSGHPYKSAAPTISTPVSVNATTNLITASVGTVSVSLPVGTFNGYDVSPGLDLPIVFQTANDTTFATINTTGPFADAIPAGYDDWYGAPDVSVNLAGQAVTVSVGTVTAAASVSTNVTTNLATASVGTVSFRLGVSISVTSTGLTAQLGPADIIAGGSISVGQTTNLVTASVGTVTIRQAVVFAATNLVTTSVGDETTRHGVSTTAATNLLTASVGNESVIQGLGVSTTAATNLITASVGNETATAIQNMSIPIVMSSMMTVSTNPVTVVEGFRVLVNVTSPPMTASVGNESVAFPMTVYATGNQVTASMGAITVIQPVTVYLTGQQMIADYGIPWVEIDAFHVAIGFPIVLSLGNETISLPKEVEAVGSGMTAYAGSIASFILNHNIVVEGYQLTVSQGLAYSPNWGTTPDDEIKEGWTEPAAGPSEGWVPLPKRENAWTRTPDVPDEIWNRQTHPPNDWTH